MTPAEVAEIESSATAATAGGKFNPSSPKTLTAGHSAKGSLHSNDP